MANHSTHKRTAKGKAQTMQRKARRALKYATQELDLTLLDLSPRIA